MNEKLKKLVERTLKATTQLAEVGSSHDTKFINVLLGIYRVSISTLRDIYFLSSDEETGASALDLTRKIIEYGVTVEYMIWKGKEKMAEQFQKHMWTEIHHELEFLKSIGKVIETKDKDIEIGIKEAEKEYNYLNTKSKERINWAGLSVEKMVEELHTNGQLRDFDWSRIGQAYVWGCRLNHVSPYVVNKYMGPENAKSASDLYLQMSLVFGILFHIRLTNRYIDEIRSLDNSNVFPEIASEIALIFKELDNPDFISQAENNDPKII